MSFKIIASESENERDIKRLKDNVRDLENDLKKVTKSVDKLEKVIDDLHIGARKYTQMVAPMNTLQRKIERFERLEVEFNRYKQHIDDKIKKEITKKERASVESSSFPIMSKMANGADELTNPPKIAQPSIKYVGAYNSCGKWFVEFSYVDKNGDTRFYLFDVGCEKYLNEIVKEVKERHSPGSAMNMAKGCYQDGYILDSNRKFIKDLPKPKQPPKKDVKTEEIY